MAEKIHKEEIVAEKPVVPHVSKEAVVVERQASSKRLLWVIIGIVVIYLIFMVIGIFVLRMVVDRNGTVGNRQNTTQGFTHSRFSNERTYNVRSSSSDGLTTTTTNTTYTQTQGVITAVNSDTIVVAGGGKTQTIKTNASTAYVDNTKPAINDTVVVVGTKDGDTITATQVAVYN